MKIHIAFSLTENPYGGGNQFLKGLRKKFRESSIYTDVPKEADVILFNSFQDLWKVIWYKLLYPKKHFIHRIDGPISLYRRSPKTIDRLIYSLNAALADGTVFQSEFSKKENLTLGFDQKNPATVILNAADTTIFFPSSSPLSRDGKIRLISVSWSKNILKGFDTYRWLDTHLDFTKYEYQFIGNAPYQFQNIIHIPPAKDEELSKYLRASHIYITASQKDPCSNSLLEALATKLPALALADGGHPEIICSGGETFKTPSEIPDLLEKIEVSYGLYQDKITYRNLEEASEKYKLFFEEILKKQPLKNLDFLPLLKSIFFYFQYRLEEIL